MQLVVRFSRTTAHLCYVGSGYRPYLYSICGTYRALNEPGPEAKINKTCQSCIRKLRTSYGYEAQG